VTDGTKLMAPPETKRVGFPARSLLATELIWEEVT